MNTTAEAKRISGALPGHDPWFWVVTFNISFLSIVGNTTVIYVILATPKLQTKQNAFILSLAVADLCVGLFITPTDYICSRVAMCEAKVQAVFYNFLLTASMTSLMAMTLDRYIAVIYPMKYPHIITKTRTVLLIVIAWLFAFCVTFIRLIWAYSGDVEVLKQSDRVYRFMVNIALGFLPCCILLFAFGRIYIAVREQLKRQETQLMQVAFNHHDTRITLSNSGERGLEHEDKNYNLSSSRLVDVKLQNVRTKCNSKHRQHSSVRVLGAVVCLFVLCYSFNVGLGFCYDFDLCESKRDFFEVSMVFVFANSSINFIVYAFLKKEFRQSLNLRFRSFCN